MVPSNKTPRHTTNVSIPLTWQESVKLAALCLAAVPGGIKEKGCASVYWPHSCTHRQRYKVIPWHASCDSQAPAQQLWFPWCPFPNVWCSFETSLFIRVTVAMPMTRKHNEWLQLCKNKLEVRKPKFLLSSESWALCPTPRNIKILPVSRPQKRSCVFGSRTLEGHCLSFNVNAFSDKSARKWEDS